MLPLHLRESILPIASVATGLALALTLAAPASAQRAWAPTNLGPPGIGSGATGVNDAGQVVGYFIATDGSAHAALWRATGDMEDLAATVGDRISFATAINSAGEVVGNGWTLQRYLDYLEIFYRYILRVSLDGSEWHHQRQPTRHGRAARPPRR